MNTQAKYQDSECVAVGVSFTQDSICVELSDGREVKTPLEFYPTLSSATPEQLRKFRLIGGGIGIHWDELDEDLSN